MYKSIRPLLFKLDPEQVHNLTLKLIHLACRFESMRSLLRSKYEATPRPVELLGLTFKNPVGLGAGYDKNGTAWRELACLGFGHIEVGTVTPKPQFGNPKPRVFRYPDEQAMVNRMGFPGEGAAFVAERLKGSKPEDFVVGVNLGKNWDTQLEEAVEDYLSLLHTFAPLADYLAINVSSPNTLGLRSLQAKETMHHLLKALEDARRKLPADHQIPMLIKLSPDLSDPELDAALDAIVREGLDGVIATNTTVGRDGLNSKITEEEGGLSGTPLRAASTEMIRKIYQRTSGKLPIIGVGGIMSATDAQEKLDAGASLVQIYSGLIYQGPGLVKEMVNNLVLRQN